MDPQVQWLLDDPKLAESFTWFDDPAVWDRFLRVVLAIISAKPADGEKHAETALRHAPKRCQRVRALGLLAQIHRVLGNLEKAEARMADPRHAPIRSP